MLQRCRAACALALLAAFVGSWRLVPTAAQWEPDEYYDNMQYYDEDESDPVYEFASPGQAKDTHDRGMARANQGNLQDALGLFQLAVKQDPTVEVFWSNLGVTQMRVGQLDEALASFERALDLSPGSSLVLENIDALREHMDHRAKQTGVPSPMSTSRAPAPPPISPPSAAPKKKTTKKKKGPTGKVGVEADGSTTPEATTSSRKPQTPAEEIAEWLGPWWQRRHEVEAELAFALQNYRPFQIRHFLQHDKALALHQELWRSPHFRLYESYERWYQYHFKAIYKHNERFDDHPLLAELSRIFDYQELREWVHVLSGSELNGTTIAGASYYAPGDYTMCHTDKATGMDGVAKRRVAFILHLTTQWQPGYGGDLVFMSPTYHIHPSFNSMTLFPVSATSWHFVSPVAPVTPTNVKRLAFSGWWTTNNLAQASRIEDAVSDELERHQFATVIDGRTTTIMDNTSAYENMDGLWLP